MKTFIPIPAGTPPTPCKSCRQLIYWAPHPSTGKNHPVSVADPESYAPDQDSDGKGITHFADCPNAASHRKTK